MGALISGGWGPLNPSDPPSYKQSLVATHPGLSNAWCSSNTSGATRHKAAAKDLVPPYEESLMQMLALRIGALFPSLYKGIYSWIWFRGRARPQCKAFVSHK